ncbi:MAG: cytochrome C oxidase subunit IV family protein [Burkholderiales bacterium]|nr:cytochrome C oxidase subunit IV family protein [Burkholderiales bacterium]
MTQIKTASYDWLILLLVTIASVTLAASGLSGTAFVLPVLLAALLKGKIIIDRFMALRQVAGPWRYIVLGWLLLVLALIGLSFLSGQP